MEWEGKGKRREKKSKKWAWEDQADLNWWVRW